MATHPPFIKRFFGCGSFLKSFLNLLRCCFYFRFWVFVREACGILVPWPKTEFAPPELEAEVLTTGLPGKSCPSPPRAWSSRDQWPIHGRQLKRGEPCFVSSLFPVGVSTAPCCPLQGGVARPCPCFLLALRGGGSGAALKQTCLPSKSPPAGVPDSRTPFFISTPC